MTSVSRRGLFGAVGAGGAAAGALALGMGASRPHDEQGSADSDSYPFYGPHQGGIVTPAQDRMHFAAFDVAKGLDRQGLIGLLTDWTQAAARMAGWTLGGLATITSPTPATRATTTAINTEEMRGALPPGT